MAQVTNCDYCGDPIAEDGERATGVINRTAGGAVQLDFHDKPDDDSGAQSCFAKALKAARKA